MLVASWYLHLHKVMQVPGLGYLHAGISKENIISFVYSTYNILHVVVILISELFNQLLTWSPPQNHVHEVELLASTLHMGNLGYIPKVQYTRQAIPLKSNTRNNKGGNSKKATWSSWLTGINGKGDCGAAACKEGLPPIGLSDGIL